jgi:peptidoglycan/xylan/chitin deacetylase (PgdA/CDA1 family)
MWKNKARAAMTLCFDDGFKETYELTKELLSEYGIRATYYVPTAYVGKSFYGIPVMSLSDLRECVRLGMEVGSHSITHCEYPASMPTKVWRFLSNFAQEESKAGYFKYILGQAGRNMLGDSAARCPSDLIRSEIALSKQILERELAPYRVSSFAYPRGSFTKDTEKLVERSGYSSARTTVVGLNNPAGMDFYALKCKVWRHYTDVSAMNLWVDHALGTEAWLIELYHHVSNDPKHTRESCPLSRLRAHLDYVIGKDVWIDTQHNVATYTRTSENLR